MSPERFDHLLYLIRPHIEKEKRTYRESICAEKRLVITIRFLNRGTAQETLAANFRIAPSTVCGILKETCKAIYKVLGPIYMSFPNSPEQWKAIAKEYNEIHNLPHVAGAIDGKHVRIDCPGKSGSAYHNYHGYFSMILLGICDAKYCFTYVDFGQFGATNDAAVLNNSQLYKSLETRTCNFPARDALDVNYLVDGVCLEMGYFLWGMTYSHCVPTSCVLSLESKLNYFHTNNRSLTTDNVEQGDRSSRVSEFLLQGGGFFELVSRLRQRISSITYSQLARYTII